MSKDTLAWTAVAVASIGWLIGLPDAAKAADDAGGFYSGKQIEFVVGVSPGGGYDLYARVLTEFIRDYIPGKPVIVIRNMPGAAGVTAGSHIYNIAARDGTVIAISPASMLLSEALNPSQVRFESRKFGWVGTIATMTDVLAVLKSSGIETLEDARNKEVVMGATAIFAGNSLQPSLVNALLSTRFKVVKGYDSGDAINLAMERGEIVGRTNQWASWKVLRPDWIRDNKLTYLVQFGPKEPDLPNVPTFGELVSDPKGKAMVDLLEINQYVGRSVFTPPDVPPERLRVLQRAFDETMTDAGFITKMRELDLEHYPRKASQLQERLDRTMANAETVSREMRAILSLK
jgi:tripartite-type tricarboxylate transporter receptor subunit TctC